MFAGVCTALNKYVTFGREPERTHHRRIACKAGLDAATQARIFEGPGTDGLIDRQPVLLDFAE